MENSKYLVPTDNPHLDVSTFSHKGLVRENNEDSLSVQSFRTTQPEFHQLLLAVLADGVGGHQAGEIASRIGVQTIVSFISSCDTLTQPEKMLEQAIIAANDQIVQQSQLNEAYKGMGSTCVSALILDHKLYMANLGDSRLYRIHNHEIQQLTFDHTWLEEISGMKIPGAEKITRSHPLAHVLNRYLGSSDPIQVDLRIRSTKSETDAEMQNHQGLELAAGDIILLTSDGVSDLLTNQEIHDAVTKRIWEKSARRLVYCALKKGGYDNATVIFIRVPKIT